VSVGCVGERPAIQRPLDPLLADSVQSRIVWHGRRPVDTGLPGVIGAGGHRKYIGAINPIVKR
jgi:hypothetical protein